MSDDEQAVSDPFQVLLDIEHRSRTFGGAAPAQEDLERYWTGVGFILHGTRYITPLDEVAEIMSLPPYTKVPGVKSWVKGIANVRGTLLPIMDLSGFLGYGSKHLTKRQRVLVVSHDNVLSGLVVDEVLGLQHFDEDEVVTESITVDEVVEPYITGAFERNEEHWIIFSLYELAKNSAFLQVAV